jgi:hypothetical protein
MQCSPLTNKHTCPHCRAAKESTPWQWSVCKERLSLLAQVFTHHPQTAKATYKCRACTAGEFMCVSACLSVCCVCICQQSEQRLTVHGQVHDYNLNCTWIEHAITVLSTHCMLSNNCLSLMCITFLFVKRASRDVTPQQKTFGVLHCTHLCICLHTHTYIIRFGLLRCTHLCMCLHTHTYTHVCMKCLWFCNKIWPNKDLSHVRPWIHRILKENKYYMVKMVKN